MKNQRWVTDQRGLPIDDKGASSSVQAVSGETVALYYFNGTTRTADAGQAAGVTVEGKLAYDNIRNAAGSMQGTYVDTSLTFTSTALTTEVEMPIGVGESNDDVSAATRHTNLTAGLANGEYRVDYATGMIYGKKASTQTSLTSVAYNIGQNQAGGGSVSENVNIAKYGGTAVSATNPVYVKEVSAGTDIVVLNATGSAAINSTTAVAAEFKLLKVTCHFSAAPTTSENFQLKLDAVAGAAYDTVLYVLNPSLSAATDIVFLPDGEMKFKTGDELVTTFTNTDTRTYGLSVYYQLI